MWLCCWNKINYNFSVYFAVYTQSCTQSNPFAKCARHGVGALSPMDLPTRGKVKPLDPTVRAKSLLSDYHYRLVLRASHLAPATNFWLFLFSFVCHQNKKMLCFWVSNEGKISQDGTYSATKYHYTKNVFFTQKCTKTRLQHCRIIKNPGVIPPDPRLGGGAILPPPAQIPGGAHVQQ